MKKSVLITLLSIVYLATIAQTVTTRIYPVGVDYKKKDAINATRFDFGSVIYNTELDSINHTLFLELRNISKDSTYYEDEGNLVAFDLSTKEIKWWRKMDYSTTKVDYLNQAIFITRNNLKITCLNIKNGAERWTSEHPFFMTFPKQNIALGYTNKSLSTSLSDELQCVDLSTGELKWKRTVNKDFGWNGVFIKNDSTIIIKSSGLQEVNLKTGKGWNYITNTGIKNYSHKLEQNLASIGFGITSGVFDFAQGNNLLNQLNSNLLVDSNYYYFASKEYIAKLNKSGNPIWKTSLSEQTGQSELLKDSTFLYLINIGKAEYNGKEVIYSKPYVAAYELSTGNENYVQTLNTKSFPLIHLQLKNDSLRLVFGDRIMYFSVKEGKVLYAAKYYSNQLGRFKGVVNLKKNYIIKDSALISLENTNPTHIYLRNTKDQIVVLKQDLSYSRLYESDDIYLLYGNTDKYRFFENKERITIANSRGEIIGKLNMGSDTFMLNNILYEIGATGIIEVDTEQLN